MAEQKNEIAKTFSETLTDKLISVEMGLPKQFNRERFVAEALSVINEKPELAKANKNQLLLGLMQGAFLNLSFRQKECYLIAYGSNINFQTDYKGEIKFTKRYSVRPIQDIYAKVVREGDSFEEKIIDGEATISFVPKPFNDGEIVGCFAVVLYKDNGLQYETMSVKEIQNVRANYSKARDSKAWKNSFDEMCKKTVLRRLCKHIDCDFESIEAQKAWEESSVAEFPTVEREKSDEVVDVFSAAETPDVIDTTATEVTDNDLDKDTVNAECKELFGV
jgi:recombination protein RecT